MFMSGENGQLELYSQMTAFSFLPHNLRMECWFYSLDLCCLLSEQKTDLSNLLSTGSNVRAILYFVRSKKKHFFNYWFLLKTFISCFTNTTFTYSQFLWTL